MKDLQTRIQQMLNEKKNHNRAVALITALSLLMMFIVPYVGVVPGAALTNSSGVFENLQYTINDDGKTWQTISHIQSFVISSSKGTWTMTDDANNPLVFSADPDTSIDLNLTMNYTFSKDEVATIKDNDGYVYIKLPSNLNFSQNYYGGDYYTTDSQYKAGPSGYYSIWNGKEVRDGAGNVIIPAGDAPLLVIRYTDAYLEWASNGINGGIGFNAKVDRKDNVDGDQTVTFADGKSITIKFADDQITVSKKGNLNKDANGVYSIDWVITVKNPGGRTNFANYTLSDKLKDAAFTMTAENCTVSPSGYGHFADGNYVFDALPEGQTKYAEEYTFTYTQSGDASLVAGSSTKNEATLTGGKTPVTAQDTVKIENVLDVKKSGVADYQDTGKREGAVNWTIEVENKSGDSLSEVGAYVLDDAFANAISITVIDDNGNENSVVSSNKTVYIDNDRIYDLTDATSKSLANQITADTNDNYLYNPDDQKYYKIHNKLEYKYDSENCYYTASDGSKLYKNGDLYYWDCYYDNNTGITTYSEPVKFCIASDDNSAVYAAGRYYGSSTIITPVASSCVDLTVINTSRATITYSTLAPDFDKTAAGNSTPVQNKAYTGSTLTTNPPDGRNTGDITVYYKDELRIEKKPDTHGAAADAFDQETGTFKWKFKVRTNASDNSGSLDTSSKESINGYSVTDPLLANLPDTYFDNGKNYNIILSDGTETTEYHDYVTVTKSGSTLSFTVDEAKMKTDGVNVVISGLEMFYKTTIDTSGLTTKQINDYKDGEEQSLTNTATASGKGYTSVGEATIPYEIRNTADKYLESVTTNGTASGQNEVVLGDADTTDRILNWKISLTKDEGFNKSDVVLTDNFTSSTTGKNSSNADVGHYITPTEVAAAVNSQQSFINLQGKTLAVNTYTAIPAADYTVKYIVPTETGTTELSEAAFIAQSENAVGFKIAFNAGIDSAYYRYIDVLYHTTAHIEDVEQGWTTVFGNNYSFGDKQNIPVTGLTFERKDENEADPVTLKLNKNWYGDQNNIGDTRPKTIKVQVIQSLAGSDDWVAFESPITLTVTSDNNYTLPGEYPKWLHNQDGTNTFYQYKIVEVDPDSAYEPNEPSEQTASQDADEMTFQLTNTFNHTKPIVGKQAINYNNTYPNAITETQTNSIPKATLTINGETAQYYLIRWDIVLNLTTDANSSTIRTLVDTIPNGAIYLSDAICIANESVNNTNYRTTGYYKDQDYTRGYLGAKFRGDEYHTGESIEISGNQIRFNVRENIDHIFYCIAVPVSELSRAVTSGYVYNKIKLLEPGEKEHSAKLKISDLPESDNEHIKKSYQTTLSEKDFGVLKYSLDFNPERKKLSNTGTVDITDKLTFNSSSTKALDNLIFTLNSVTVKEYDANGSVVQVSDGKGGFEDKTLNPDEYSYTVEYPDGRPEGVIARLNITVPDEKYYKIEYEYKVTGFDEKKLGASQHSADSFENQVVVDNEASFETDNASGYDKTENDKLNVYHANAWTATTSHLEIYKTDDTSLTIKDLSAKFYVAKYDTSSTPAKWIYANGDTLVTPSAGNPYRTLTFDASNVLTETSNTVPNGAGLLVIAASDDTNATAQEKVHKFSLDSGIYKFVEVEAPEGYISPPKNGSSYETDLTKLDGFIYLYGYNLSTTVPSELSGVTLISEDTEMDIANDKYVSISVEKNFKGIAATLPSSSTVTTKLYWSYQKSGGTLNVATTDSSEPGYLKVQTPSSFENPKTIEYDSSSETNIATWTGLPSGINGKKIYYFVKEESYTIGSNTYTVDASGNSTGSFIPVYTNNGINTNGGKITINNVNGLSIQKVWSPSTPPYETGSSTNRVSVGFRLTAKNSENAEVVFEYPAVLTSANNYLFELPKESELTDTNGDEYLLTELKELEIEEILMDEQIAEDYNNSIGYELAGSMGVITMTNTSNLPETISVKAEKNWVGSRTDPVTVQLYKTQVPGLTPAQIVDLPTLPDGSTATVFGSPETLNSSNSFSKTWSGLDNADSSGERYYYYVKEISIFEGVTTEYAVSVTSSEQKTTITNREEANITVNKQWAGMDSLTAADVTAYQQEVVVELKYSSDGSTWQSFSPAKTLTLNGTAGWSQSFTDLEKTDSNSNPIHYRVFERSVGGITLSDSDTENSVYRISYSTDNVQLTETTSQSITVLNSLKVGALDVTKQWRGGTAADHEDKTVTVNVYRAKSVTRGAQGLPKYRLRMSAIQNSGTSQETETELTGLSMNNFGMVRVLSNDQVNNNTLCIDSLTYDSTNHTISFTIPKATWNALPINNNTNIALYVTAAAITSAGLTGIKFPTSGWQNSDGFGYWTNNVVIPTSAGGDWAIQIYNEVTEDNTISFNTVDPNALPLSFTYNNSTFNSNTYRWLGSNFVVDDTLTVVANQSVTVSDIPNGLNVSVQDNTNIQISFNGNQTGNWQFKVTSVDTGEIVYLQGSVTKPLSVSYNDSDYTKNQTINLSVEEGKAVTLSANQNVGLWQQGNDTSKATASINGTMITIEGLAAGTSSGIQIGAGNECVYVNVTVNPTTAIHPTTEYAFATSSSGTDNNVIIPSDLRDVAVDYITLTYKENLTSYPSYDDVNAWISDQSWNSIGGNSRSCSGNVATFDYGTGARNGYYFGIPKTSKNEELLNAVIHFVGGSTFTITNLSCPDNQNLTVSPASLEIFVGDTATITPSRTPVTYTSNDTTIATVDSDGTVHGVKVGTTSITVTYGSGDDAQTATVQVEVKPYTPSTQTVPDSVEAGWSKTITLSDSNDWHDALSGLPLTAPDGTPYIYYIQESTVEGYVPISYTLDGVEGEMNHTALTENASKSFTVENAPNSEESSEVTLPESGSTGTRIYYTIGAMLLLLSAAGYTTIKRRRWYDE